jgi:hypothetical protein
MRSHAERPGVQELGCRVLRMLASTSDLPAATVAAKAAISAGALTQIVAAMRTHATDARVQEEVITSSSCCLLLSLLTC